ncbi:Spore germination protein A1 [Paenibacillus plantiphilus]|uniref:Spore germination protein A1 n=1 Tax=Paenibacillus plantiphilus TaxID=2905650 RepID=A0ABM9CP43_9BACL|nr:spore germination protein [Paenibacillus plantiphilus]CAH1218358.1 Spore germination protein A1 [Paenibacillus plantiphilus]
MASAIPLSKELSHNSISISSRLGNSLDVVSRRIGGDDSDSAATIAILYIDSLVDQRTINDHIVQPLMNALLVGAEQEQPTGQGMLERLSRHVIAAGSVAVIRTEEEALEALLNGFCVIMVDGTDEALIAVTAGGEQRSVDEPVTQTVIRGPQHSFTENIFTNLGLIRRIIRSPNLRLQGKRIGRQTQTHVFVASIKGIAKQSVVDEVLRRLDAIDIDGIIESSYVEEFIQDRTFTPFPTLMNIERPDVVAASLLEGQVAVIVDGTPFVLLAPVTFFKFFQSAEDYYQRFDIASFLRLLRHITFIASMLLPALYIAITTYHQEMLPTTLLISLAAQREGIPFPALFEAFLMEITFEVLREAGVRMPRAIGPAVSIVGALVLGQAAVQAGLVSPAMVIVVSFTAISNFVTPQINIAIAARLIRFSLMLLAGMLGLYGIMTGVIVLLTHLAGLQSFGVPYMAPVAPFIWSSWKDIFIRVPRWAMKSRPEMLGGSKRKNNARMPDWQRSRSE